MSLNSQSQCYCGNNESFESCCKPLLEGKLLAKTAEQLMRSRYSAFCTESIDYLIDTLHPDFRSADDRSQLASSIASTQWLKLKVRQTWQGQASEQEGQVEFIAYFKQDQQLGQLHERSQFKKIGERWFYTEGEFLSPESELPPPKLGRNDPCWCGSGLKFKKCHG